MGVVGVCWLAARRSWQSGIGLETAEVSPGRVISEQVWVGSIRRLILLLANTAHLWTITGHAEGL